MTAELTRGPRPRSIWNGRLALLLLLACFFVPAAVAWTLFFTGWTPSSTGNHGELIQPPQRLDIALVDASGRPPADGVFRGRWSIVLTAEHGCGPDCERMLDELLRVRVALAQHADRTRIMLVLPTGAQPPALPDAALERALSIYWHAVPEAPAEASRGSSIELIDTRGFAMMRYPQPFVASGLLADLKKLLRISNIDLERLQGLSGDA
jgi:hypothetical protein